VVWQWQRNRGHRRRSPPTGVAPASIEAAAGTGGDDTNQRSASLSDPLSDPVYVAGLRPIPSGPIGTQSAWPASDIVGVSPSGARLEARLGAFDGLILLAFLTTRCDGCEEFWDGLRDGGVTGLPEWVSAVIVTKGPTSIGPAEVGRVATGITRVPVIMSDQAWTTYRVSGYPFFVLVDAPARKVVAETVGFGWSDVISMIRAARL
jgi:hypothetical protein